MSPAEREAAAIADEQIAFWQHKKMLPEDAWRALGLPWGWGVDWWEVRIQLIGWQMGSRELAGFKHGPLPAVPAPFRSIA